MRTVYYVAYVDEQGRERVTPAPYARKCDAQEYCEFLVMMNHKDCHVREADPPTGEVLYPQDMSYANWN